MVVKGLLAGGGYLSIHPPTIHSLAFPSLSGPAPAHHPHDYEWGPSGLRVFEAAAPAAGGDVAAIAAGRVSVSPLRAALAPAGRGRGGGGEALKV